VEQLRVVARAMDLLYDAAMRLPSYQPPAISHQRAETSESRTEGNGAPGGIGDAR
jgi:hypothetical protein